jgi:DNA segregation ATPase FtsK/SpoIIIE-like protein
VHIAFHSGSKEGSIAILDKEGAEDLLGQGDMIVQYFNEDSQRLQGYCLEEEVVEKMIF